MFAKNNRKSLFALPFAAVLSASPASFAQVQPQASAQAQAIEAIGNFNTCIDVKMGTGIKFLGAMESCLGRLKPGSEVIVVDRNHEGVGWNSRSQAAPLIRRSKEAFGLCAVEAAESAAKPITQADLNKITKGCEVKYFPDCDCHVEAKIEGGVPTVKILPGRRPKGQEGRTDVRPNQKSAAVQLG